MTPTRPLALALVALALSGPAFGQDKPADPAADASKLKSKQVLADLILAAQQKKVLQHRLLTKRTYRLDERGGTAGFMTTSGKATSEGFEFLLSMNMLERGKLELRYAYGVDGRLSSMSMLERREKDEDRPARESGIKVVVKQGSATATQTRNGEARNPVTNPWGDEYVSLFALMTLIPSLSDLADQSQLSFVLCGEDDDIGRREPRPREFVVTRAAAPKKEGDLQLVTVAQNRKGRSRPLANIHMGTGKDEGVIRTVVIDPKPDGRFDARCVLITEKEAEELVKLGPVLGNERKALSAMRSIRYGQQSYQQKKSGAFADSLEELGKANAIYEQGIKEGTSPGYLLMLRASADGKAWMAVAVPESPKTGRYYYAVGTDGKYWRSKKPIELDDTCTIPPGLEEVHR